MIKVGKASGCENAIKGNIFCHTEMESGYAFTYFLIHIVDNVPNVKRVHLPPKEYSHLFWSHNMYKRVDHDIANLVFSEFDWNSYEVLLKHL